MVCTKCWKKTRTLHNYKEGDIIAPSCRCYGNMGVRVSVLPDEETKEDTVAGQT